MCDRIFMLSRARDEAVQLGMESRRLSRPHIAAYMQAAGWNSIGANPTCCTSDHKLTCCNLCMLAAASPATANDAATAPRAMSTLSAAGCRSSTLQQLTFFSKANDAQANSCKLHNSASSVYQRQGMQAGHLWWIYMKLVQPQDAMYKQWHPPAKPAAGPALNRRRPCSSPVPGFIILAIDRREDKTCKHQICCKLYCSADVYQH